jgi:Holliday junction resolvasome RuvABC endonuclease subunit
VKDYILVGFDPASTRNIGWSVLTLTKEQDTPTKVVSWEGGTFVMGDVQERWQVLWPMFMVFDTFLTNYKPDLVIVEKTSSFAGGFITGQVSHCMGVLLAVCGKHNVPVDFVFPTSVKKGVAGHGRASKSLIKKAVIANLAKFDIQVKKFHSQHTADATANLFFWLMKNNISGLSLNE